MAHRFQKTAGRQSPPYFHSEDNAEDYDFALLRREKLCRRRRVAAATARSEATAWAREVPIVVAPLPADLRARARAHFGHHVEQAGLEAFVRHCFSNYEALLPRLREWPPVAFGAGYAVLRTRVDADVRTALSAFAQCFPERPCRRPMWAARRRVYEQP